MTRDLGDRQTPLPLARDVVATLLRRELSWTRVLEPTAGTGSFLVAALEQRPSAEAIGIEIQASHLKEAQERLESSDLQAELIADDIFTCRLDKLHWRSDGPLLVVGNPPWVTAAELGALGSKNLPTKVNLNGLKGLDALTGESNFDIAEYILLKLIRELSTEDPVIAVLVKTAVARRVLRYIDTSDLHASAAIHRIDARRHFSASVDACLFIVDFRDPQPDEIHAPVFDSLTSDEPEAILGFRGGEMVADLDRYLDVAFADGSCNIVWRQGVKHDAAAILELAMDDGQLRNGLGEQVDVEDGYIFPLLKGSDVYQGRSATRCVILPQRNLGEETSHLRTEAPRLHAYLTSHEKAFTMRKSSIYRGKPPFSVFGIGPYTFSPWKIAISGLHKDPRFRLVGPKDGKPVILDDTCYLLPFDDQLLAVAAYAVLASTVTSDLMNSLIFRDSKRPVTKRLLKRIDMRAVSKSLGSAGVEAVLKQQGIGDYPSDQIQAALERLVHQHQPTLI